MPTLILNTNRKVVDIDFISSINRIENNIDLVRSKFITPIGWQDKKTWGVGKTFSHDDANRYENNLYLLYELGQIAQENLIYCGTFSCGTEWEGGLYA